MAQVQDVPQADLAFIRQAMATPLLDKDDEQALATAWATHKDEKALHKIINAHTRLVVSIASKFKYYGLPISDLIQEGNVGLMQAAARFEPSRDVRFSTYASWWIKSCIQDFVLRNWSIVRVGTTTAQKALFFNLRRLRARIEDTDKAEINDEGRATIAQTLGVNVKDVMDMEQRMHVSDQSLNSTIANGSDDAWQDFLADERPTPEDYIVEMRTLEARASWLNKALSVLSERERRIISARRLSDDVITLEDLGRELGVSKERVRQLENRALEKMKSTFPLQYDGVGDMLS